MKQACQAKTDLQLLKRLFIKTTEHSASTASGLLAEFEGIVSGHRDGHGFVQRDDGEADIYLAPNEMRAVLHKDRVKARIVRHDRKNRPEGRVTEILERSANPIIGRLLQEGGVWLVAPEDKRYGQDVLIPKGATGTAKTGQVVVVQLTEPPALFGQPVGRVKEVLGEIDDPGMEIEIAVRKYGVPHEFSDEAMALARTLPDAVRPQDKQNRVDLTDIALVTIDGEDARDFDDAVYCEPAKVGRSKGWRLLVAIADVSHYVETGSAIDIDAYDRATSVYFPRRVIPMLPEKLSNGLCSLNPKVERLCMVCDMLVTAKGDVHAYQFYPAVMFSQARFTYTEVAAILANTRGPEAAQRKALVPHLLDLHDVYQALLKERGVRGAVVSVNVYRAASFYIVTDIGNRYQQPPPFATAYLGRLAIHGIIKVTRVFTINRHQRNIGQVNTVQLVSRTHCIWQGSRQSQRGVTELVRHAVLTNSNFYFHARVVNFTQHFGHAAYWLTEKSGRLGQLHHHDLARFRGASCTFWNQHILAIPFVFRRHQPDAAFLKQAANDRMGRAFNDLGHAAFWPIFAVMTHDSRLDAVLVQHCAHFVRRQIDVGLAIVALHKTVAVTVARHSAFKFSKESGSSAGAG